MIAFTDKIFQRVQLKNIQARFDYVLKQYKLVVDRIEQEMENRAEDEDDSPRSTNFEVSGDQL
jgi:hypothetical protein